MKILVFGGTGFLGKNLVERLLADGHEVGMYVRSKALKTVFLQQNQTKVKVHIGDFQNERCFETVVSGYEVVYHLISSTVPGIINPLQDIETTIKPSIRLLEACSVENIQRVIFFSSGGTVYGVPQNIPLTEEDIGQPISAYGIQKQALERYMLFYQYVFGLPVTILRIANPYGRYQRPFSKQGLIANLLGNYLSGNPVEIWGDGEVVRDYIYVDDVIEAAVKVLAYKGSESVFNIGSGYGSSVNDIIMALDEVLKDNLQIKRYPGRRVDVPVNVLDIKRAQQELSWHPQVSLKDGLQKMLTFWNEGEKSFAGKG